MINEGIFRYKKGSFRYIDNKIYDYIITYENNTSVWVRIKEQEKTIMTTTQISKNRVDTDESLVEVLKSLMPENLSNMDHSKLSVKNEVNNSNGRNVSNNLSIIKECSDLIEFVEILEGGGELLGNLFD